MSTTIDQKVVEMRFDNKDFEANVKQSMSTLDKLKEKLNFKSHATNLDNVKNSMKDTAQSSTLLGSSVDTVKMKFSAMEVIAITALQRITNQAMDTGERLIKSLSTDQISAGWSKYGEKTKAVQTIMSATGQSIEEVNSRLEKLNWFTDETSYNFTDMTSNIGKFTSQGVDLDTAVTAMEGIATWAAISGQGVNEASRAMYNLSQSLGVGYVKLQDWMSIENANMATKEFKELAIETAVELGTLSKSVSDTGETIYETLSGNEVTFQSFRDNLKDGWFSNDVLTATLKQYGGFADGVHELYDTMASGSSKTTSQIIADLKSLQGAEDGTILSAGYTKAQISLFKQLSAECDGLGARAFAASQEAKTFSEAIDSVKDAVSTGWMSSFEIIFGDYTEAKSLWTDMANNLWEIFAGGIESRNDILEEAFSSPWKKVATLAENAGISVDSFKESLAAVGKESGVLTDEMLQTYGSIDGTFKLGWVSMDLVEKALDRLSGTTSSATSNFKDFEAIVNKVINGDFGNGAARVKALTEAGEDYAFVQDLVNKKVWGQKINWDEVNKSCADNQNVTQEQIDLYEQLCEQADAAGMSVEELIEAMNRPSGRELLHESINNILEAIIDYKAAIGEGFAEVFPAEAISEGIYKALSSFRDFTAALKPSEKTMESITNLTAGFLRVLKSAGSTIKTVFNGAIKIANNVLGKFGFSMSDVVSAIGKAMTAVANFIDKNNIAEKAMNKLGEGIEWVVDKFLDLTNGVKDFIKAFDKNDAIKKFTESMQDFFKSISTDGTVDMSKIGANLSDFASQVSNIKFEPNWEAIGDLNLPNLFSSFKNAFNTKSATEEVTKSQSGLKSVWDNLLGFMRDYKGKTKSTVSSFKTTTYETIATALGSLEEHVGKLITMFTTLMLGRFFLNVTNTIDSVGKALTTAISSFSGIAKSISSFITNVSKGIKQSMQADAMVKMIIAIVGAMVAVAGLIWFLGQMDLGQLEQGGAAVAIMAVVLTGIFWAISKMKPDAKAAATIFALAICLLSITQSVKMVVDVVKENNQEDINKSLKIIVGMLVALTAVVIALNRFASHSPDKVFNSGAVSILAIAIAIRLIVGSLKTLSKIDSNGLYSNLGALVGVMVMLGILMQAMRGLSITASGGLGIVMLVLSLGLMTYVLEKIASMDTAKVMSNLDDLVIVMGSIVILMIAARTAGEHAGQAGGAILMISMGIIFLSAAINMLGSMEQDTLNRGLQAVGMIKLMIVAMLALFKLIKVEGKDLDKVGTMVMKVAIGIIILCFAIAFLGSLPTDEMWQGVWAVSVLMIAIGAMSAIAGLTGGIDKSAKGLISLAAAVAILAVALYLLAEYADPDKLQNAALCLGGVMVAFAAMEYALSKVGKLSLTALGALIILAGVIVIIGVVLQGLSKCEGAAGLIPVAASIGLIMISMAAVMWILSNTKSLAKGAISGMYKLLVVVGVLAIIMWGLSALNVNVSWKTIGQLILLFASVTVMYVLLSALKTGGLSDDAIAGLLVLAVVMLILGVVLAALSAMNISVAQETVNQLCEMLITICAALILLEIAGLASGAAMAGLTALGALFVGGGVFAIVLGFLADTCKMEGIIVKGLDLLVLLCNKIGEALGAFVGGMVAGYQEGAAAKSVEFAEKMVAFSETMAGANEKGVSMADKIVTMLSTLGGAQMNSALAGIMGGDFGKLGKQLEAFAEPVKKFSESISATNIDTKKVEAAAKAGTAIAQMSASISKEGGLMQGLLGSTNLEKFSYNLSVFGGGIKNFAQYTSGLSAEDINTDLIDNFAHVISTISTIPKTGGLLQEIMGDIDMGTFKKNLKTFAQAFKAYSEEAAGISPDGFSKTDDIKAMMETFKMVPVSGGIIGKIFGSSDLGTFAENLKSFGKALSGFSEAVQGINADDADKALTVMKKLGEFNDQNQGKSFWENITSFGSSSALEVFGGQMVKFSESLKSYAQNTAEVNVSDLSSTITSVSRLSVIISQMSERDYSGINSFVEALKTLGSVTMSTITDSFYNSVDDMETAGAALTDGVIRGMESGLSIISVNIESAMVSVDQVFESRYSTYRNGGLQLAMQVGAGIYDGTSVIQTQLQNGLKTALGAFKSFWSSYREAGRQLCVYISRGISDGTSTVSNAVRNACVQAKYAADRCYDYFYGTGKWLMMGLESGINAGRSGVVTAAANAANAAAKAARDALEVKSPSKVGAEIGRFFTIGLANGITEPIGDVEESSANAAKSAISAVRSALSMAGDYAIAEFDSDITIRPVVDLTDVNAKASLINGVLGGTINGTMSPFSSIQNGYSYAYQPNSNADVVSAIAELRSDVQNLNGAVASMQLVLDTGQLVGGIYRGIDRRLGAELTRKNRGV